MRKPKGVHNRIARDLKRGIITAAVNMGSDGKGKDGLIGYLEWLARRKPQAFAQLLGKLIPLQLDGDLGVNITPVKVNIISVPSAHYIRADQVEDKEPLPEGVTIGTPPEPQPEPDEPEPAAASDEASAELITFPARKTGDQK